MAPPKKPERERRRHRVPVLMNDAEVELLDLVRTVDSEIAGLAEDEALDRGEALRFGLAHWAKLVSVDLRSERPAVRDQIEALLDELREMSV